MPHAFDTPLAATLDDGEVVYLRIPMVEEAGVYSAPLASLGFEAGRLSSAKVRGLDVGKWSVSGESLVLDASAGEAAMWAAYRRAQDEAAEAGDTAVPEDEDEDEVLADLRALTRPLGGDHGPCSRLDEEAGRALLNPSPPPTDRLSLSTCPTCGEARTLVTPSDRLGLCWALFCDCGVPPPGQDPVEGPGFSTFLAVSPGGLVGWLESHLGPEEGRATAARLRLPWRREEAVP